MGVKNCIDNISGIPADVTFRDLRVHYRTGRAVRLSGTGRDKEYTYRVGVQTDLGDIELPIWQEAMQRLIHASGEDELQQALLAYVKDHRPAVLPSMEHSRAFPAGFSGAHGICPTHLQ